MLNWEIRASQLPLGNTDAESDTTENYDEILDDIKHIFTLKQNFVLISCHDPVPEVTFVAEAAIQWLKSCGSKVICSGEMWSMIP